MEPENKNKIIIFYDGECYLCNWGIQFLIKRDKNKKFIFLSQQSPLAGNLLKNKAMQENETVILIHQGKIYTKSTAVIYAVKNLDNIWRIAVIFKVIPKNLRDWLYDFIARNRKRWFGSTNYCRLPDQISNF